MLCKLATDHPVTDAACKAATGRTFKQWHAMFDELGGPSVGRRNLTRFMYDDHKVADWWWCTTTVVEYEKLKGQPNKKDGLFEGYGICVTKSIAAPLDALWEAWTDNAKLSKWFGAGTKADVKDGGSYSNKDGDTGKYLRVRAGKDLRFSWENPVISSPTLVDVVPTEKGAGKSHVMLNHTRIQQRAEADGLRVGWTTAFDALKKLLES